MINFRCLKLAYKYKNNRSNIFNFRIKSYLSTSKEQTKSNLNINKINLKEEFQEMLNEAKVSEEQIKRSKLEDNIKIKEVIDEVNKEWNEKNNNLKNAFNKESSATEENEKEINENKIKNSFYSKFSSKKEKQKSEKKYKKNTNEPNINIIYRFCSSFAQVWKQTFPGEENPDLLLERRKLEAQILKSKIKEATEEEIAEIEASIPEWKRGAVILLEIESPKEKQSIFEIARKNLSHHVRSLKIYKETQQSLKDSELSLLMEDFKKSYSNIKDNLKESQNPLFVVSRDLIDKVSFKSPSSQAISIMRKYDPHFELITFEKEVDAIFKQLMEAFFKDKLDIVKSITSETALAVLMSEIKSRKERKIECKYKEFLYQEKSDYVAANVIDEDNVILRFRIVCQEINCKISQKDGTVIEGKEDLVLNIHYMIDITRNPQPVVEELGHPYMIVGLERVGVSKQIL